MTTSTCAASTTIPTYAPIFLEIGVNGDMQKALAERMPLSVILFDAYCPTKSLENQTFRHIVCPREPVSPEATSLYGITAEAAAKSPQFGQVWKQFLEWAAPNPQTNVIIVAHKLYKQSLKFLDAEAANAGLEVPAKWVKFDTCYLASFLDEFRDCGKDSLPQICTAKAISVTGNSGKDVHSLLTKMANPAPLENLYSLMLYDPKHPIKPVGDHLRQLQTAQKTNNTAIRIIYFDLETTGLRTPTSEPRIVEISAFDPERKQYFTTLVNPEMFIPEDATRIHGITDSMVRESIKASAMFAQFIAWAEKPINGAKPKVVLVGYNSASYDFPVIKAEAIRAGTKIPYEWGSFCIFRLVNTLRIKDDPNRKLQTLREKYAIPPTQAHRAQGDTEVTYQLALKLFNKADINAIHREIATPGPQPYIRVANIIRQAGGPSPFASGEDSVKPAQPTKAAKRKAPTRAAQVLESDDSDSESLAPVVQRQIRSSIPLAPLATMPNTTLALKFAAQIALEMAALVGGTTSSASSSTTLNAPPAPTPVAPPAKRVRRRVSAPAKPALPVLPVRKLIEDSDSDTDGNFRPGSGESDDSDSSTIEIA
jgi:DNA polymerase-3 subunit epsilon